LIQFRDIQLLKNILLVLFIVPLNCKIIVTSWYRYKVFANNNSP